MRNIGLDVLKIKMVVCSFAFIQTTLVFFKRAPLLKRMEVRFIILNFLWKNY